jgi:hypothetical protein
VLPLPVFCYCVLHEGKKNPCVITTSVRLSLCVINPLYFHGTRVLYKSCQGKREFRQNRFSESYFNRGHAWTSTCTFHISSLMCMILYIADSYIMPLSNWVSSKSVQWKPNFTYGVNKILLYFLHFATIWIKFGTDAHNLKLLLLLLLLLTSILMYIKNTLVSPDNKK